MPHTNTQIRKPLLPASAAIALLACLGLAACGGSSSTSTSSSTTSASTNAANAAKTSTAPGHTPGRFAALRACLQKNGVTLPAPTPGHGPLGLDGPDGRQLPKGVTRAQVQAAMKKCDGGRVFGPNGQTARRHFGSPGFRKALSAFAACMRSNGVNLPAPDTSGTGPVFKTGSINTKSTAFKAASAKCESVLRSAFPRRPPGAAQGGAQ